MGFWHTGYMEFHEATGEGSVIISAPKVQTFPCGTCAIEFLSERDLRVHTFEGHPTMRPVLVLRGRECGRSRLTITRVTSASDWVIRDAQRLEINGKEAPVAEAGILLAASPGGVVDVKLANGDVAQEFQFEFALADEADLAGVDAALARLIDNGELSLPVIDSFIMRSKGYFSAARYLSGLADYLYGVLAREGAVEMDGREVSSEGRGYEAKYDRAVGILGSFDRPAAEAICGLVAFHYNQFSRAMTKTKSQRVADVALRIQAMLLGGPWQPGDLAKSPHASLDFALSDSVIEQVLRWSAVPLDGSAVTDTAAAAASIPHQRPYDAFKLHLVVAEHSLAAGDVSTAKRHAERLRHGTASEAWYHDFRRRLEGAAK